MGNHCAEPMRNRVKDRAVHGLGIARRVDQDAADRVFGGDVSVTQAQPIVEISVEAFETVGSRACCGASEPDFDGQIQN